MTMRGYDVNDYEDWDEYEDEEEEQEAEGIPEEEYEEEAPQPTQEELEYLELRQRLKDDIRKKIKTESGSSLPNLQDKKKKLPYDNYGSFFGPSQPVIAQRVIQESKSLLENHHLADKVAKSHQDKNKSFASSTGGSKTQVHDRPPKVVNQLKIKVQKLKNTRDYSFLLSGDAELPAPTKDPPPRNVSVPNSEARPAQGPQKSKQFSTTTGRQVPNGRDERKHVSTSSQMHSRAGSHKLNSASKPVQSSVDSRKQLGNSNGSGPGRPLGLKGLPSKMPGGTIERRVSATGPKSSLPSLHKASSSKLHSSAPQLPSVLKQPLNQTKEIQESRKGKMLPKQPVLSTKPQMIHKPKARPTLRDDRPKKKTVRQHNDEDEDQAVDAISVIRKMFSYNPAKFADRDYDDRDMEANFHTIMREEARSARLGREEDEEEERKLAEEERRERLRKEAKKRKLSQR